MQSAIISRIEQATPTVKVFTLDTGGQPFVFRAGQWMNAAVDVDADEPIVGGYSMTSSPLRSTTVEIAVKRSFENPAGRYLHERAREGETVYLDGGHGPCFFEAGMADAITLIAGGIGITPLMSMVRYAQDAVPGLPITLIHSAHTADEHLFRSELERIAAANPNLRCLFTVSGEEPRSPGNRKGRIDAALLREAALAPAALHYVCGPGAMIDAVSEMLVEVGVDRSRVRFERWW